MNVRPAGVARMDDLPDALIASAEDPIRPAPADHAGVLEGATVTGEAARQQLSVRIALWLDDGGAVRQARWRAVRDAGLRACAEAGCALLEAGADPARVDANTLRRGADAGHTRDCAEVVAAAIEAAVMAAAVR